MRVRPLGMVAGVVLVAAIVVAATRGGVHISREPLPLTNSAIIREQASAKHLDPALVAAVIYAETKFDPRPSAAGAQGLMQILPSTAHFLAGLSGGIEFTTSDLANPSVNIAYGSYYLRYLLDHYGGAEMPAVAAYNAGWGHVDEWMAQARARGEALTIEAIPFPETRDYVEKVMWAQGEYRSTYPAQLGPQ
jgi:soluble lytic murein transglycosylase